MNSLPATALFCHRGVKRESPARFIEQGFAKRDGLTREVSTGTLEFAATRARCSGCPDDD